MKQLHMLRVMAIIQVYKVNNKQMAKSYNKMTAMNQVTVDILVKVEVRHKVRDECVHLLLVPECKERNQTHESLEHSCISTNEWTVDTIKQHYQLVLVTTQLRKLLHKHNLPSSNSE